MSEVNEVEPASESVQEAEAEESVTLGTDRETMPRVDSRFMFVDIAALRAKQLRRGAVPRVTPSHDGTEGTGLSKRFERIAMQEVEEGLIVYDIPPEKPDADESTAAEARS